MVSHGTVNLENYLTQIELAFREFEEVNGKPDTRVAVFSLRPGSRSPPTLRFGRPPGCISIFIE